MAHYTNDSCKALASYAASSKDNPSLDQVAAVHLIAHETMHVNGYWSESEAECRAAQLNYLVAEKLGATEGAGACPAGTVLRGDLSQLERRVRLGRVPRGWRARHLPWSHRVSVGAHYRREGTARRQRLSTRGGPRRQEYFVRYWHAAKTERSR